MAKVICKNCGSEVELDPVTGTGLCMACGRTCSEEKKFVNANEWDRVVIDRSNEFENLMERVRNSVKLDKYPTALEYVDKCLEINAKHYEANFYMAVCEAKVNNSEKMLVEFLNKSPENISIENLDIMINILIEKRFSDEVMRLIDVFIENLNINAQLKNKYKFMHRLATINDFDISRKVSIALSETNEDNQYALFEKIFSGIKNYSEYEQITPQLKIARDSQTIYAKSFKSFFANASRELLLIKIDSKNYDDIEKLDKKYQALNRFYESTNVDSSYYSYDTRKCLDSTKAAIDQMRESADSYYSGIKAKEKIEKQEQMRVALKKAKKGVTKLIVSICIIAVLIAGGIGVFFMVYNPAVNIYLKGEPQTIDAVFDDSVEELGLTLIVEYKKGNTKEVSVTSDMLSGYEVGVYRTQTGVIKYKKLTKEYSINVSERTLEVPEGLVIKDGVVVWNAVAHALSYGVIVDGGSEEIVTTNSYVPSSSITEGSHTIIVRAKSDRNHTNLSSYSTVFNVEVLEKVTNLKVENGIAKWEDKSTDNAYKIYIDNVLVNTTSFGKKEIEIPADLTSGEHTISVSVKGTSSSLDSGKVDYEVSKLEAPSIGLADGKISFQTNTNTFGYILYEGKNLVSTFNDNNLNEIQLYGKFSKGTYNVSLVAKGNGSNILNSAPSNIVEYKFTKNAKLIRTGNDLKAIKREDLVFILNDIDLSGFNWTPIFTNSSHLSSFTGEIIGNGFKIYNLNIQTTGIASVFGYMYSAYVENLTIEGTIVGKSECGAFANEIKFTTIKNCKFNGTIDAGSSGSKVGGIVGYASEVNSLINCEVSGNITGYENVGGIVGKVFSSNNEVNFINCVNNATVSGTNNVGGIVGIVSYKLLNLTIDSCVNNGKIKASGEYASGIIGKVDFLTRSYECIIIDTINNGNVTANKYASGIAYVSMGTVDLRGLTNTGTITSTSDSSKAYEKTNKDN